MGPSTSRGSLELRNYLSPESPAMSPSPTGEIIVIQVDVTPKVSSECEIWNSVYIHFIDECFSFSFLKQEVVTFSIF